MTIKRITSLGIAACLTLSSYSNEKSGESSGSEPTGPGTGFEDGIPLETDLPKSANHASPKPEGLRKLAPETKEFPKFLVPKYADIISIGKPVTSSDKFPIIGEVSMITDGKKEANEGFYIELLDGLQWVQIDLKKSAPIYAILVWHFHGDKRVYHDVVVQVSNDPKFEKAVTTLYNNDYDNSSKLGKGNDKPYIETRFGLLVNGKATKARYVRLYCNGSSSNELNHYIEVEVWGQSY